MAEKQKKDVNGKNCIHADLLLFRVNWTTYREHLAYKRNICLYRN